ncbi:GNAT family N-acetyltransferase [Saccharopolyspora taberi]|uniref:GNAT family N-acetyltransferase n=1 Tax=Saccharopolyspora taberi TaxID=60895 RepID=A0ABN3VHT5_9PSEU
MLEDQVERAAVATWPASTVERADGWFLRHCEVVRRKRSNSALPPAVIADVGSAVEAVEGFYAERGCRPVVQVSPLERHGELDGFLAGRGYRAVSETEVMVADVEPVAAAEPGLEVRLEADPHESWFAACAAVGQPVEPGLDAMAGPAGFAVAVEDGVAAGVGLFAVSGSWCGVYCMATAESRRRRGVAGSVLRAGARWAAGAGARRLFLQVEADNPGARALYEKAGFRRSHGYHYRVG